MHQENEANGLIIYTPTDEDIQVEVVLKDEDVWASQKAIAKIFSTERSVITKHIRNIFLEGELDENNNVHFLHIVNSQTTSKIL